MPGVQGTLMAGSFLLPTEPSSVSIVGFKVVFLCFRYIGLLSDFFGSIDEH